MTYRNIREHFFCVVFAISMAILFRYRTKFVDRMARVRFIRDSDICELISQADKLNLKVHDLKIKRTEDVRWISLVQQIQSLSRNLNDASSSQYYKERRRGDLSRQGYAIYNDGTLNTILYSKGTCFFSVDFCFKPNVTYCMYVINIVFFINQSQLHCSCVSTLLSTHSMLSYTYLYIITVDDIFYYHSILFSSANWKERDNERQISD
jgi:hypothetical protein